MKVGLYITTMIHDITRAGFSVGFIRDFDGMMRMDFFKENDPDFYEHAHCGVPGGTREKLEKDIIQELIRFKTIQVIEDATRHEDEPPPKSS